MNKQRRGVLEEIFNKLADLHDTLEEVKDEEEYSRNNMPENLQDSERYEKADKAVNDLEDAISLLEEAMDYIKSAKK